MRQYLQKLEAYSRDRKRLSELEMQIVVLRALGETLHALKHPSLMHTVAPLLPAFERGVEVCMRPKACSGYACPLDTATGSMASAAQQELHMLGHVTVSMQPSREASSDDWAHRAGLA